MGQTAAVKHSQRGHNVIGTREPSVGSGLRRCVGDAESKRVSVLYSQSPAGSERAAVAVPRITQKRDASTANDERGKSRTIPVGINLERRSHGAQLGQWWVPVGKQRSKVADFRSYTPSHMLSAGHKVGGYERDKRKQAWFCLSEPSCFGSTHSTAT